MACTVEQYLNVARSWLGAKESDGSHMRIINIYNSNLPLPRGYRMTSRDAWCACFVTVCAIQANAVDIIGKEIGVERHIVDVWKPMGIWIEDGRITPRAGDIVCYNYDDRTQPNDGWADHVGIVERVAGNVVHTIEGNVSDSVARRQFTIGHGQIRGFARPRYLNAPTQPTPPTTSGFIKEDGLLGPETTKRWQAVLGLSQTGVINRDLIRADQRMLNAKVRSTAIKDLTAAEKLDEDGIEGPKTIRVRKFYLFNTYHNHFKVLLGRNVEGRDFNADFKDGNAVKMFQYALNQATSGSKQY